ncbi:serine hydrolase domain-containing protein [Caulobacter sp. NIBR2454]|uniref:serine hydrolase domain-containing protein n=1 Tax=Caulobacter sp. NIBR2454 TaxID=3015996 RepID=UPI0022B60462|nr:serine hydrolase domain-containing protein [Caulobacter sp. NIBR2454]
MFSALAALFGLGGGKAWAARSPVTLSHGRPEDVGFDSARLARLDDAMRRTIASNQIAGGVTLLARRGKIVSLQAYGQRDINLGDPMTTDAIFRIRSETKPVTGLAMMMLYEQGLWGLDDPITTFIPEFTDLKVFKSADPNGAITEVEDLTRPPTMRELMTHTAGFAYGLAGDSPPDRAYLEAGVLSSDSLSDMINRISTLPMFCQPGVMWRYSIATDIQGHIVERLSGMSLPEFMKTKIFAPLGMDDTDFYVPPEKRRRLATLYDFDGGVGRLVEPPTPSYRDVLQPPVAPSAGGGLVSTARDYARFCQLILNGGELDGVRLVKPETVALMGSNHLPASFTVTSNGIRPFPFGPGLGFGLNVAVAVDPALGNAPVGKGTVSWGGSAGTWFWVDPTNDLFFIGMIQRVGGIGSGLDAETRSLVYQALADRSK